MLGKICVTFVSVLILTAIPSFAQQPGWLGVSIEDQKDGGPVIRTVERNSPAEKAGLREGDVIVEYTRESVVGAQQLTRLIRETPVGRTADVKVRRDGREQTIQVTIDSQRIPDRLGNIQLKLPNVDILMDQARRSIPRVEVSTAFVQSGIRVDQMTDQLRKFFGVSGDSGVLVSSVEAGSVAEKAGLIAGDVITAIDGQTVRVPSDFSRQMRAQNGKVTLKVLRDKQEREMKLD